MRRCITSYVNRCINCLYYKKPSGKPPGFLHPLDKGSEPFVVVHMDHLGPFIKTKRDNKYIIAAMCGFSKYCMFEAVPDTSSTEILLFLNEFISHYGKPKRIITDRGTAFTANDFEEFCDESGAQHVKIASATPRANCQLERLNRLLLSCVATTCNREGDDWDTNILQVQWTINNIEHNITKPTPYKIIFKRKGIGVRTTPLTREILELNEQLNQADERESVTELLRKNQEKMKIAYDKRRKPAKLYKQGELVLVRSDVPSTGQNMKLELKYKGPYEIVKSLGRDRYLVQDIEGERQSNRIYKAIIAVDRLKPVGNP
ncbi:hypothetical protein KPH14_000818 [Odynerus spinipes]|uniref:Integrase catalytic domain-containing protein n=1 Tax=Odynerus spinipes TaxID=1348599 RepID=A0AAD9R919_9HYME|nr:hypothetical protein KPH14_000818 [Odynerus spinipes]